MSSSFVYAVVTAVTATEAEALPVTRAGVTSSPYFVVVTEDASTAGALVWAYKFNVEVPAYIELLTVY
jgi:hypothetical protein